MLKEKYLKDFILWKLLNLIRLVLLEWLIGKGIEVRLILKESWGNGYRVLLVFENM